MKNAVRKKLIAPAVETRIHLIRGQKIMLDMDLAALYGVKPTALRQQVKRNPERFPSDFMFKLSKMEAGSLVSQSVIPHKKILGGSTPYAFTQEGVAMLSSVLRSPRAVQMNIAIMRAFVRMRELVETHREFARRLEKLEKGHTQTDSVIEVLVEDIDKLSREVHWIKNPPVPRKHPIGFIVRKDSEK